MRLAELLKNARPLQSDAEPSLEIAGITLDSRQVQPGWLFFAIPGFKADGHGYIGQAAAAGAAAVMTSRWVEEAGVPQIRVADVRESLAQVSATFYGSPSERMRLVGITGTNGKTTTSYMMHAVLGAAGIQAALLGGVEYIIAGQAQPATRTTPESPELQAMLAYGHAGGDTAAVLEVSSHGIDLYRAAGLSFDAAVFTNLTRDHLDLHGDMEGYYRSKRKLFFNGISSLDPAGQPPAAAVNTDNEYGRRLADEIRDSGRAVVTCGAASGADVSARDIVYSGWETSFELVTPGGSAPLKLAIPGSFSLANALAAAAGSLALGLKLEAIVAGLDGHRGAPGRLEVVGLERPFRVVVDYAHNEDGLERTIATMRSITPGRLIVVFGCPGDRDREKRPGMGLVAGTGADLAILTTDDCYSEPPDRILTAAESGLKASGGDYRRIADRREAIAAALGEAGAGDTVLIAGKGHEKQQILAAGPVDFNDAAVVRELAGGH